MIYIYAYIGVLLVFLILDAIWLGLVAKGLYRRELGALMRDNPRMTAAALFYAVYAGGVVFLAVDPALATSHWSTAALYGAVLGALAYGTYGVTNYAILNGWSLSLTVADTVWGAFLTAASAVGGFYAARVAL